MASVQSVLIHLCLSPEPYFVQAVDYGDFIYFFFREIAMEYNSMGKVSSRRMFCFAALCFRVESLPTSHLRPAAGCSWESKQEVGVSHV